MAKQVLIIEDEDAVAKAVGELVSTLGEVTTTTAKNGAAGMDLFRKQSFDAVLLDILLPGGMDGYKVAEAIRDVRPSTPILVMSGFLKDPKAQKDLQTRFSIARFLPKPLKPDDVKQAVASALGISLAAPAAAPRNSGEFAAVKKAESFSAELGELTVGVLFGELLRAKAEGVLDLTRGQHKKRFYLQRGWFRYATSNVRAEMLAGLLPGRGVAENRLAEAQVRAKNDGMAFTDALVALRIVAERDVPALLTAQTEEIAITALTWPDGHVAFKAQPVESGPEGRANPVMCVLKGVKRLVGPEDARAALQPTQAAIFDRTPEMERELFAIRNIYTGETITPAINGKFTLGELVARAKDVDAQLLYALFACGLARARGVEQADLAKLARPPTAKEGLPAARPGQISNRTFTSAERQARDQIFAEQKRQQGAKTHYEVLGVSPRTDAAEIKSRYFALARQFHNDSFAGMQLGDAQTVLEDIFKRVSEANKALSSDEERITYDKMLDNQAKGLPTSVDQIMQAESTYARGEGARKAGRLNDAEKLYRQAVQLNAGESNYLIALGTMVHQLKGKAGDAEVAELLDKALKIKQDSLAALVLRARLHLDAGEAQEALEMARSVIEKQSGFPGAMEIVREAKAFIKGGGGAEKGGLLGKLFGGKK